MVKSAKKVLHDDFDPHCKRCGGSIGVGRVMKYVGTGKNRKGPYHEWCAALVRGGGKVQKW